MKAGDSMVKESIVNGFFWLMSVSEAMMIIKPWIYGLFSCIIPFLLVSLCIFAKYRFLFWIYKNLPW
ncbi:hypothetical protein [Clostridium phage Maintenon]|uniref:hypothetical protein n=1 Tax=Clostridium innocuum TaxID=1522 RepID=UPI001F16A411|nr:hypothetical protein [[Clostridium] innocuum]WAK79489.1 hypothetical protein [Clostridium phage Maintenon]DAH53207.1 MAG TPA: hypothetical protein [Caudoviricetes sp.]